MRPLFPLAAVLGLAVACSSPTEPTPPTTIQAGGLEVTILRRGTITGAADGVPWTSVIVSGSASANVGGFPGVFSIAGSDNAGLYLSVSGPLEVGTHDLDGPSYVAFSLLQGLGFQWSASKVVARGQGSLTLTTATRTRVAGQFSFTAASITGAPPETRTFTNGTFDLSQ